MKFLIKYSEKRLVKYAPLQRVWSAASHLDRMNRAACTRIFELIEYRHNGTFYTSIYLPRITKFMREPCVKTLSMLLPVYFLD